MRKTDILKATLIVTTIGVFVILAMLSFLQSSINNVLLNDKMEMYTQLTTQRDNLIFIGVMLMIYNITGYLLIGINNKKDETV